jgi:hypothetical protein
MANYKENVQRLKQESGEASSAIYVINDIPDKEYLEMHNLQNLLVPLQNCSLCSRSFRYPDIDDAFQHLQQFHAQKEGPVTHSSESRSILGHWLVSTTVLEMEQRNTELASLLSAIRRRATKILQKAYEIRSGVADENRERPQHLLLPSNLVKAAEKTFQMIYTSLHAIRDLQTNNTSRTAKKPSLQLHTNIELVDYFGIAAETMLSNAQNELLLMMQTGSSDGTSIVQYISTPPETMVLYALMVLISRELVGDLDVEALYRNHLSSLVSSVLNITSYDEALM